MCRDIKRDRSHETEEPPGGRALSKIYSAAEMLECSGPLEGPLEGRSAPRSRGGTGPWSKLALPKPSRRRSCSKIPVSCRMLARLGPRKALEGRLCAKISLTCWILAQPG